ncbi:FtsK/SpoIIIE domain-containing protein [Salinibacterium sp. ZJ454]|uniref:FtsK/SpoIIIE domain-containing protein n=1 Tax=Salinibacterium sp. ZJ454 TaxID=2708339 RepID=UPI0014221C73|nr:FtsK/SpoIIIE domain-containing protein [Salinibacterium sp. ZJ454]
MSARAFDPPPSVSLPSPPAPVPTRPFPVLATVAPVLVSLGIWAVTETPFALLFAMLGPVVAVASLGDGAVQSRRHRRTERRRFDDDCHRTADAIGVEHDRERAALQRRHLGLAGALACPARDPTRWVAVPGEAVAVVLGLGVQPSALRVDRAPTVSDETVARALRLLQEQALWLDDAPVVVDARAGIGVVGPPGIAHPIARSLAVQLAHALPPAAVHWRYDPAVWRWASRLPHSTAPDGAAGELRAVRRGSGESILAVSVAVSADLVPGDCAVVLRVGAGALGVLSESPDDAAPGPIRVRGVTAWEAEAWAERLARLAGAGAAPGTIDGQRASLPAMVELAPLLADAVGAAGASPVTAGPQSVSPASLSLATLACPIGRDADGIVWVDLVADGPHALVAGMTGSGKSELLTSWILSMATGRTPETVTFLLIDFKGGATFRPLAALPHCVGVITDLDGGEAARALDSLRAELRHRERELARLGRRSIDDAGPRPAFPRLVIVVDEYAAMIAEFPELATVFGDIAARGRSLGVHLVLCTQRPGGVVRDGVLANAAVRISLRVNNRADSIAVVDVPDAAELPTHPAGRAVFSAVGPPRLVQVAKAATSDLERAIADTPSGRAPRRPWCDPLPALIPLADLQHAGPGIPFGLTDLPHEQRQQAAVYHPQEHGHLVVIGGRRSGKSTLLSVLAADPSAVRVGAGVEAVWDAVEAVLRREVVGPRLLLLDDLDSVCAKLDDDYRHRFIEMLTHVARDTAGVQLVITAQRATPALQVLLPLFEARLTLRLLDRHEHLLAGGDAASFLPNLPPGGGHWRGDRVQVAHLPQPLSEHQPLVVQGVRGVAVVPDVRVAPVVRGEPAADRPAFVPRRDRDYVVAADRPAECAAALRGGEHTVIELGAGSGDPRQLSVAVGERHRILVADPDAWQSWWGALGALRAGADLIVDGCTAADYRQLTRDRALPPPFEAGTRTTWLVEAGAPPCRIRLRGPADVSSS